MRSDNMMMLHANNHYHYKEQVFTGADISVERTYRADMGVTVEGKTEQKTLTGKNLLDTSFLDLSQTKLGITYAKLGDGQYLITGTHIGDSTSSVNINIPIGKQQEFPAGTYSTDRRNIDGYDIEFYAQAKTLDGVYIRNIDGANRTIDTPFRITSIGIYFNASIVSPVNLVISTQLELGSVATAYEPYCGGIPSPNPDYPQPIIPAKGSVVSEGRNLFNGNAIVTGRLDNGGVGYSEGTSKLGFENDTVVFTLVSTWKGFVTDYINAQDGTSFTVSCETYTSGINAYVSFYDSEKIFVGYGVVSANPISQKIVSIPTGAKYFRISFQGNAIGSYSISKLQIELGSNATPYQPYYPPSTVQSAYPLYAGDKWNVVSGEYVFEKAVYEFTGNETFSLIQNEPGHEYVKYPFRYGVKFLDAKNSYNVQSYNCTHFIWRKYNYFADEELCTLLAISRIVFRTAFATVADFKSWLAAQKASGTPVTIVYQRATPLTVQGTANSLKSVPRHTNIFTTPTSGGLVPDVTAKVKTY